MVLDLQILSHDDFDIDLAFNAAPVSLYQDAIDVCSRDRLTSPELWKKDLIRWIKFVRDEKSLHCHEFVRKAHSLSIGLALVDDKIIRDLNFSWRQRNEVTDVLSFPILDENSLKDLDPCLELGDIVVSVSRGGSRSFEFVVEYVMD